MRRRSIHFTDAKGGPAVCGAKGRDLAVSYIFTNCKRCEKVKAKRERVEEENRPEAPLVLPLHVFPIDAFDVELEVALTNACRTLGVDTVRSLVLQRLDEMKSTGFEVKLLGEKGPEKPDDGVLAH
jgi:hypothetical protein